jgi:hypothetical protein
MNRASILLCLLTLPLLASCSLYHKNFNTKSGPFDARNNFVMQIDDYGQFWDPGVSDRALDEIRAAASRTNTIVLLYIHGWHHNAHARDRDLASFADSVAKIREKLDDRGGGIYRRSRVSLTGDGEVEIFGIYVGWRGKSLPMPLDYLTFWDRKIAAERVGQGDLKEFLVRLNALYQQRLAARGDTKTPFMGMISFGHSFGGQVLFQSVAGEIERELVDATANAGMRNGKFRLNRTIEGFGTMTVLVNPALEASQYEKISTLGRKIDFDSRQTPVLLVISSATDVARQVLFPLGRRVSGIFRARPRDEQKQLRIEALGEYEPQRTHGVELTKEQGPAFRPENYADNPCEILAFDLTNIPAVGGVRLTPNAANKDPFNPFLVAYASGEVVIKHSGIFEKTLRNFLNDYVAFAQGKKILLAGPSATSCAR